jgi:non-specific serine/threonine protein kinase
MPRRKAGFSTGHLPAEPTSFVGRRRELDEVKRLLGAARLVTLTGVGGTGKTRLALRVAGQVRRLYPDGAWFVDLTALRAPELVAVDTQDPGVLAYLVMTALGLREERDDDPPAEQLVRSLAHLEALLVLDNCEHLLPACAVLAESLLLGCPGLRIVATSREPLMVPGEALVLVPPLPVPEPGAPVDAGALEGCEAAALFLARARAVDPGFDPSPADAGAVAELCRRLDGLPLAIELAAARVRVLTPEQILLRLSERFALLSRGSRSAPERQQTLRTCVDWSFDLCAKPERLLWARLSVFVGGCDLEAIEDVCADETLPGEEMLDVVTGLVDKSVLVGEHVGGVVRYRMLETLRDYGRERRADLEEDEDELRRRHGDWCTRVVCRAEAEWISARQGHWFARLDRELPNIRAALRYGLADPGDAEAALAVAAGLLLYWLARGLPREGRSWLDQALSRPTATSMTQVKALSANAILAGTLDDPDAAGSNARRGRQVAARLGDARAHAIASIADGVLGVLRADLAGAVRAYQAAADGLAAEQAEYLFWRLSALGALARAKGLADGADGGAAVHELVSAICHARGESWFLGLSLYNLGLGLWRRGETDAATARLREGLRCLRGVGDTFLSARCLDALAWIRYDTDPPERVATLMGITTRLAHTMGTRLSQFAGGEAVRERAAGRARAALGERAYQAAFARGEALSLDEAVARALDEPPAPAPPAEDAPAPLTRREEQVAALIAQGRSNREIAAALVISQRTAESHVEHILDKLGFGSRAQVAAWMAARHPFGVSTETAGSDMVR